MFHMKAKNCSVQVTGGKGVKTVVNVVLFLTMLGLIVQGGRLPCHGMLSAVYVVTESHDGGVVTG